MTSIVEFLTARIDEDETIARRVEICSRWNDGFYENYPGQYDSVLEDDTDPSKCGDEFAHFYDGRGYAAAHAARHDPARVLRECAAKRELINLEISGPEYVAWRRMLLALAAVYADHPQYRKEWAQ